MVRLLTLAAHLNFILWKISSTLFHNFELVPICSSRLSCSIRGKLAQAIHCQKLPKMCCFSSLQHNNALMFLSPQNCPYLMIVRFNNCLDILAYIICGVLLKTAKISSWAWNLVGFFSLLLLLFHFAKRNLSRFDDCEINWKNF